MPVTRPKRAKQNNQSSSLPVSSMNDPTTSKESKEKEIHLRHGRTFNTCWLSREEYMDELHLHHKITTSGIFNWQADEWPNTIAEADGPSNNHFEIQLTLSTWCGDFAEVLDDSVGLTFSSGQKNTIMSLLKGHFVEDDMDSIYRRCPPMIRQFFLETLLMTFAAKEIYSKLFTNPFWYFDGKTSEEDEEGDGKFSLRLQYLYQRFVETNPQSAGTWRSETVRLANSVERRQAPDHKLGKYHKERRVSRLEGFVKDFLAREHIGWLLRKGIGDEDEQARRDWLLEIFERAEEIATAEATERGVFRVSFDIKNLPERFDVYSKEMGPYPFHFIEKGDHRMDGHPLLWVVQPLITLKGGIRDCAVGKAIVVVEDDYDHRNHDYWLVKAAAEKKAEEEKKKAEEEEEEEKAGGKKKTGEKKTGEKKTGEKTEKKTEKKKTEGKKTEGKKTEGKKKMKKRKAEEEEDWEEEEEGA